VQTFTQVVYIGVLENGALGRRNLECEALTAVLMKIEVF
jgi:hypothetical protein